jgi:hypothetical protein
LVVVVPLKKGVRQQVEALLETGPPFDLGSTHLERHEIFITDHEVIFDFQTRGSKPPLELEAWNPALHEAAEAWENVMAGSPRKALEVFSWKRAS